MNIVLKFVIFFKNPDTKQAKVAFDKDNSCLPSIKVSCGFREAALAYLSQITLVSKDWLVVDECGFIEVEENETLYLLYSYVIPEEIKIKKYEWCDFADICNLRPITEPDFEIITRCINTVDNVTTFQEFYNGRKANKSTPRRKKV